MSSTRPVSVIWLEYVFKSCSSRIPEGNTHSVCKTCQACTSVPGSMMHVQAGCPFLGCLTPLRLFFYFLQVRVKGSPCKCVGLSLGMLNSIPPVSCPAHNLAAMVPGSGIGSADNYS
ncbi:hypothetical protein OTU49_006110 [Cherax quadricarinatus]|uniref:Uncharacterized protein n=1 Tax=Cherax quadricarinatus TaxID=27406 RepID=A0AAW0WPX2_CHEQU